MRHFETNEIPESYVSHPVSVEIRDLEGVLGEMRIEGLSAVKRLWEMMRWVFDDGGDDEGNQDGDWV